MTECYSKWTRLSASDAVIPDGIETDVLDCPRVVIDNRFSKIADSAAEEQVARSMAYLSDKGTFVFKQAILILKNGSERLIE